MAKLLVIDDEPDLLLLLLRRLPGDQPPELIVARTAGEGIELARRTNPDAVLLDVGLPDASGLSVFPALRELDPLRPIIFITGDEAAESVIEAMRLGAHDYLTKPVDPEHLQRAVGLALEVGRLRTPAVVPGTGGGAEAGDLMVGSSPAMREVYKAIGRVAAQNVSVLITGETGTGKELVARALHQHSRRADKPFLAVNCAALPEALLESELFGHEKGAFTGADRKRVGKLEQCDGGTIFLDEIGDMTPLTQAKVLRALQEKAFERVGGNETLHSDVRVLAATHRDLVAMQKAGTFRADLYFRVGVVTIDLPPLRARGDDLMQLAHHYLRRFSREFGKGVDSFTPETTAALRKYRWPGNIRELQSVLKQAVLRATGTALVPAFLPRNIFDDPPAAAAPIGGPDLAGLIDGWLAEGREDLFAESERELHRLLLPRVLRHTNGNQSRAAKLLGISRRRLRELLRDLGLAIHMTTEPSEGTDAE